ncbi:nucleotide-binding universal stress UspA family protein [Nocardioides cavernae]|uniref:Nucleotide-binding universal stress UspA family protein n=1 Tax=Nocardioides cavernae TaxID=1921566 RepID=A0A7Y9KNL5_9ACTN|nr:universal stress protein [Nocardioides cavernae]NYE35846.1 nucleotide-binding universal stress UspA family protein [Nocardioides cavernae]
MTTRILTGVDDTETALEAARTAARLAVGLGAELHVISAYGKVDAIEVRAEGKEFNVSPEDDARRVAEAVAQVLRDEHGALTVESSPAEGKPAEALVRVAESLDADVIVVGNKRVQGLARVLGSVASDVTQKAHCDVYVAHTHPRG